MYLLKYMNTPPKEWKQWLEGVEWQNHCNKNSWFIITFKKSPDKTLLILLCFIFFVTNSVTAIFLILFPEALFTYVKKQEHVWSMQHLQVSLYVQMGEGKNRGLARLLLEGAKPISHPEGEGAVSLRWE